MIKFHLDISKKSRYEIFITHKALNMLYTLAWSQGRGFSLTEKFIFGVPSSIHAVKANLDKILMRLRSRSKRLELNKGLPSSCTSLVDKVTPATMRERLMVLLRLKDFLRKLTLIRCKHSLLWSCMSVSESATKVAYYSQNDCPITASNSPPRLNAVEMG